MSTSHLETPRRPAIVIALHWLTLAALVCGVLLVLVREQVDGRTLRDLLLEAHRHMGLVVFALLFGRLAVRLVRHRLPPLDTSSRLACAAALATHLALYLLLGAVPVLGWMYSNAHGQDIHFLGIPLPALTGADDDVADTLQQWHKVAAWSLLALGFMHAMAALWHHFIRRDQVLTAMLPQGAWRTRRDQSITTSSTEELV